MKSFLNAWKNAFGYKGHKKKYGVCLGAILLTMLCTGCKFNAEENVAPCVYGPPEDVIVDEVSEEYDPSNNLNADVYGPPEWFDEDEDPASEDDTKVDLNDEEPEYNPEENVEVCVYGPPEDM